MAYHVNAVGALDSCCQACHLAELGTKLDTLIYDLSNDTAYSGDSLTASEIAYLNGMCVGAANLGTLLDGILTASQDYTTVSVSVTDAIKTALESVCETFRLSTIGTRLQAAITAIDAMTEYNEAVLKTLYFTGYEEYPATIDDELLTVAVELPAESVVTALVANFTLSDGATATISEVEQVSGTTENDFTSPVSYLITSQNLGETNTYVVTVTVAT